MVPDPASSSPGPSAFFLGEGQTQQSAVRGVEAMPELRALVAAYLRSYPGMSEEQARTAVLGQAKRTAMLEWLQATLPDHFGGSWYDPRTNTQHLYLMSDAAKGRAEGYARELGLKSSIEPAAYSYRELEALAKEANTRLAADGLSARQIYAAVDGSVNRVAIVTTGSAQNEAVDERYGHDARIVVKHTTNANKLYPGVCTSRTACGKPARSGIVIGIDPDGAGSRVASQVCSLGYTAAGSDGSRWVITAGHCGAEPPSGTKCGISTFAYCWGHGEQYFGLMRDSYDSGNVDVGRIKIENAYWTTGGYFYNASSPNTPLDVDLAIRYRSTLQNGDGACQSMWHAVFGASCGTIVSVSCCGRGLVRVDIPQCPGDSGGGWYQLVGSERWAIGIHHGGFGTHPFDCHPPDDDSVFSALPDINAYWDSTTVGFALRVQAR
jgi:hypothetical protein